MVQPRRQPVIPARRTTPSPVEAMLLLPTLALALSLPAQGAAPLTLSADTTPAVRTEAVVQGSVLGDAPNVDPRLQPRADTLPRRRAVEHSDAYYTRLRIHRVGSYAMLPLFAGEYLLGEKLLSEGDVPGWVKPAHGAVAGGLGVVFTSNTITGVWNLVEARHEPQGRLRRTIHAAALLAADAGFVATGIAAGSAEHGDDGARRHKQLAIGSMALSTAGTAMMWLWKD